MKRTVMWLGAYAVVGCSGPGQPEPGTLEQRVVDGPVEFADEVDISEGDVRGVSALDARDLDGDGLVDVALFEGGKHAGGRVTVAWYQAPASGGSWIRHEFSKPPVLKPFIGAAKLGDVDGDGDDDVVLTTDNHSGATKSAYVYWLENPRPSQPASSSWTSHEIRADLPLHHINDMALADLDGDTKLDVLVRSLDPNQLHIYFQNDATDWAEKVLDTSVFAPTGEGLAIGDIDRKGELDITTNGFWWEAPDDPRNQPYTRHAIDDGYVDVNQNTKEAVGDINGDGRADVIISPAEGYRDGNNHVLAWYEGPTDPTSVSSWTQHVLESDFNGGHTVQLGDMDGDGDLDVMSGVAWSMWGQQKHVAVYFNLGAGNFGQAQIVVTGKGVYTGVLRDVGADGDLDIIGQDGYAGESHPYLYESLECPVGGCASGGGAGAGGTDGGSAGTAGTAGSAGAGTGGATAGSGGATAGSGGATAGSGGATAGSGGAADAGASTPAEDATDDGGCSCQLPSGPRDAGWLAVAVLALATVLRRREARRR